MPQSQNALTILMLQKCVLETMLSDEKFQKTGTPHALIENILSIIITDSPKTYFLWRTSFKAKQFLYMVYQTVFQNTPELNQFIANTSLDEKRKYGLKAGKELELNIPSSASTPEINQYLAKIVALIGTNPAGGGPSAQW